MCDVVTESLLGAWLRWSAASMAVAAGVLHLAQLRVHADEDPLFGLFFLVVGVLQVAGGLYVARPLGPPRAVAGVFTFGVVGSLATIATWALSRSLGLPFGAEPGEPEEVGLADAAAGFLELFAALSLLLWLRYHAGAAIPKRWTVSAFGLAAALAVGWIALRSLGRFDPDPRLVLEPALTDAAAVASLVVLASFFALIGVRPAGTRRRFAGFAAILVLTLVEVPLVAFTLPARGGQNVDCSYAPLGEDSGHLHARPPRPIEMGVGERRSVVVLLLIACADAPVRLEAAVPLRPHGSAVVIDSVSVDRSRPSLVDRVRERPGPSSVPLAGVGMQPGAGRYPVTIEVRAVADGDTSISAFRIDYVYRGQPGSFGFASTTLFCVGQGPCAFRH